jgi:hypothetical protein
MDYKNNPPPGTVVLSDGINDAWPELMNLFLFYCQRNGTDLKPDQLVINTPEEHRPQMEILQAQEKFQDRYYEIMKKHDLDYLDGARAGIIACSIVFQYHCVRKKDVDPHIAAGIVSMGIVSGAKTAPMPLKPENAKPDASPASGQQDNQMLDLIISIAQNSIDGSGTRLVLGEGMASMQEALHNGGKYILVNPGVISKLEENNIDPFLIYAAAIRMEVASGISRIDFVGANVDKLLEDWGEKPERQVPIHVRQLLWLKNNANKYSYERNGNSWRLKL